MRYLAFSLTKLTGVRKDSHAWRVRRRVISPSFSKMLSVGTSASSSCFYSLIFLDCDSLLAVFSFTCLHQDDLCRKKKRLGKFSADGLPFRIGFYFIAYSDDDESKQEFESLGLGDFFVFNVMLLWILPPLSTLSTKVAINVGHVVAVHVGLDLLDRLARHYEQILYPALPLSVVAVSIYAFLLNLSSK